MFLLIVGCSPSHSIEPDDVVLTYGHSSISAVVKDNNEFESIYETDTNVIAFSGKITEKDTGYLVDALVVSKNKVRHSERKLNTTVLLKMEDPIVIGGINDDSFTLTLKRKGSEK